MNKNNLDKFSTAIVFITIGLLFLFANLGYISFTTILSFFFRFWPIFIIIAGIKIVLGGFKYGYIVAFIIDVLVCITIVSIPFVYNDFNLSFLKKPEYISEMNKVEIMEEKGYQNIKYDFDIAASEFNISDNGNIPFKVTGENLVSQPKFEYDIKDNVLDVRFKSHDTGIVFNGYIDTKYDISMLNRDYPVDLDLKLGAVDGTIQLEKTILNNVKMDVGAGDVTLDLRGSKLPSSFKLNVGAGNVVIKMKKSDNISISYNIGVGSLNIKDGDSNKSYGGLSAKGNHDITKDITSSFISFYDISIGAGNVDIIVE